MSSPRREEKLLRALRTAERALVAFLKHPAVAGQAAHIRDVSRRENTYDPIFTAHCALIRIRAAAGRKNRFTTKTPRHQATKG